MKTKSIVKKGSLLLFSEGEYSDYGIQTVARALVDFDVSTLKADYERECPRDRTVDDDFTHSGSRFLAWIINTKGLVEEVEHLEIYLGRYGDIEPTIYS